MGNGGRYTNIELGSPGNGELERTRELRDLRIDKLNQRVTFISILIPCLICAVLLFVYFDIRKQVVTVESTGVSEVDNLSKSIETRLTSLTLQNAELEYSVGRNSEALKTLSADMDKGLLNAEEAVNAVEDAKAEKEELEKLAADLTGRIEPLEQGLEKISASSARELEKVSRAARTEIEKVSKAATAEVETVSNAVTEMEALVDRQITDLATTLELAGNRIVKLQKDLAALSKTALTRNDLDSALGARKKAHAKQLAALEKRLKAQRLAVTDVKSDLLELEKITTRLEKEMFVKKRIQGVPDKNRSPKPSAPSAVIPPHKRPAITMPKDRNAAGGHTGTNNIVEQELSE